MATKVRIETVAISSLASPSGAVVNAPPSSTTTIKEVLPIQASAPIGNVALLVVWGT